MSQGSPQKRDNIAVDVRSAQTCLPVCLPAALPACLLVCFRAYLPEALCAPALALGGKEVRREL